MIQFFLGQPRHSFKITMVDDVAFDINDFTYQFFGMITEKQVKKFSYKITVII